MAFYNEKDYLFKRKEKDIEDLDVFRDEMRESYRDEMREYYYLLEKYNEYIEMIADFLKVLNLNSSLECALAVRYLIFDGIVSFNDSFNDKKFDFDNELCIGAGINIVSGEGCCRNVSDFYKAIMDKLELYCKKYYCHESNIRLRKKAYSLTANHVANVVEYDNGLYVMDIYNNLLCRFISASEARSISLFKNMFLSYKPYYEYVLEDSSLESIKYNMALFEKASKRPSLNQYTWNEELKPQILSKIKRNYKYFNEFGKETKNIKKEIKLCLTK